MVETYDAIVLGVGGFGSGALDHLARRGARVLGIERFGIAHDRGSSHGETRIIRKAYFQHPDYVPLLQHAYKLWKELEADVGKQLYCPSGLLLAGPPQGNAISGARLSAQRYQVPIEEIPAAQARERFNGFHFPQDFHVLFEPEAGYLKVEECIRAQVERAQSRGAVLKTGETVHEWKSDGRTVHVQTDRNRYQADSLIVTAGPWASQMLKDLSVPLRVVRKPVLWFPTTGNAHHSEQKAPAFYFEMPTGDFYGFPSLDRQTVKVSQHSGGSDVPDPLHLNREQLEEDVQPVARFIREVLPQVAPRPVRHSVCMYTHSPDGHFLLDRHPAYENVLLAAGFSRHGFKFVGVLGDALADLACKGRTDYPVDFLKLDRPSLSKG